LLLEIANCNDDELKKKYGIIYKGKHKPYICFATINFYNEIDNPQQRGMLEFFDKSFIAKYDIQRDFISKLSTLLSFISDSIE